MRLVTRSVFSGPRQSLGWIRASLLACAIATASGCVNAPKWVPTQTTNVKAEAYRIRSSVIQDGADIKTRQRICLVLDLPNEESDGKTAEEAEKAGYRVSPYKSPQCDYWTCELRKNLVPATDLESAISYGINLAKKHGGEYGTGEAVTWSQDYDDPKHEIDLSLSGAENARSPQPLYFFIRYLDPSRDQIAKTAASHAGFAYQIKRIESDDAWDLLLWKKMIPFSPETEKSLKQVQEWAKQSGGCYKQVRLTSNDDN
jgi:hypothetical protein